MVVVVVVVVVVSSRKMAARQPVRVGDVLPLCDGAICSLLVFLGSRKKPIASPDSFKCLVTAFLKIRGICHYAICLFFGKY